MRTVLTSAVVACCFFLANTSAYAQAPGKPTLLDPSVKLEHLTDYSDQIFISGGWVADEPDGFMISQVYVCYREIIGWVPEEVVEGQDPVLTPVYRGRKRCLNLGTDASGTFTDKMDYIRHILGDREFEVWIYVRYYDINEQTAFDRLSDPIYCWGEDPHDNDNVLDPTSVDHNQVEVID